VGRLTVQRSRAKEAASLKAMAAQQEAPAASPTPEAVDGRRIERGNPIAGLVLVPERWHLHPTGVAAGFAGFRGGPGGEGAAEPEDRRRRPASLLFPARSQQARKHHQHRVRNADRGSRWDAATCSRPAVSSLVNSSRQVRPGKTPEYDGESGIIRVVK
jgi:hypothetical protein